MNGSKSCGFPKAADPIGFLRETVIFIIPNSSKPVITMKTFFNLYKCAGLFTAAFLISSFGQVRAQVTVTDSVAIDFLVNEVLLGGGITATNITFNEQAAAGLASSKLGTFSVDSSAFPIAEGMVMATGTATGIAGEPDSPVFEENFTNDPDLMAITAQNMNNCAIIEFDFTATTDTFLIDYVFSSMEYQSFTCSPFNDAFGIFLSGPGISGQFSNNSANIALIPDTDTPVAINSVNSGSPSAAYPAETCLDANPDFVEDSVYFFNNQPQLENSIAYNGHTHMFTAFAQLIPGETYHFKFAIGNASDAALQSAVLMRKGSVNSGLVTSEFQVDVNTEGINVAPEGIYIAGTFNYFVPEAMEMISENLYRFGIQVPPNVNVTYKFLNGNGPDAAELVPDECSISGLMPDGSRHVRMLDGPLTLDPVCFSTCEVCADLLSVNDAEPISLGIFPNPAKGQFQIVPPTDGQTRIRAFDVQGRMVADTRAFVNAGIPVVMDLPAKGLYKVVLYYEQQAEQGYSGTVVVQ